MKGFLFFTFFFCVIFCFAQESAQDNSNRVSVGLEYGQTLGYRWLNGSTEESDLRTMRNANETARIGTQFSGRINIQFTEKFSLESGLGFSSRRFQTQTEDLNWSDESASTNLPTAAYRSFHYNYFDIPLRAKFALITREKFNFSLGTGIIASFLLSYQEGLHTEVQGTWEATVDDQGTVGNDAFNGFATLSLQYDYFASSNLTLSAKLGGAQSFKGTNSNLLTQNYLNGVGLSFGIWYAF